MSGPLAGERTGKTRIGSTNAEVRAHQMRCGARATGRQGRCRGGVRPVGRVAALGRDRCECGGVGAERRDLERDRGCELELLLEGEVPARVVVDSRLGLFECRERVLPGAAIRVRELDGASADRIGLCGDSTGVVPLGRAARDHRDQPCGERHGKRGGGSTARRAAVRRDAVEKRIETKREIVVGAQGGTSLRLPRRTFLDFEPMPLYLTESDVTALLTPADAVDAIEGCFRRMAAGEVELAPRRRLRLPEGSLADMAASDLGLGLAGGKLYAATPQGTTFVVCLFDAASSELVAVIEADQLGRLRTGAASGVAARHLARTDARTLGVLGCGHQAETQVSCIRAGAPSLERVVAYCRTPEKLAAFCAKTGAEPAEGHREAAEQDVVVTMTSSRDPVVRGEWLSPGALVIGAGANVVSRRELDNAVLERARFVCCDWREQAKLESGDLVEPIQAGVLDWLEVHELHEVVSGEIAGRQSDDDVVVFKSNGLAAWDVALGAEALARARERGVGLEL